MTATAASTSSSVPMPVPSSSACQPWSTASRARRARAWWSPTSRLRSSVTIRPIANASDLTQVGVMSALYDTIGINYADLRKPDPRIAKTIEQALGPAKVVLNVGAGTGSYEPPDRQVTAVEPSAEMISQRRPSAAKAIQAFADDLPFEDGSFEASMAILTIHHWPDKA